MTTDKSAWQRWVLGSLATNKPQPFSCPTSKGRSPSRSWSPFCLLCPSPSPALGTISRSGAGGLFLLPYSCSLGVAVA